MTKELASSEEYKRLLATNELKVPLPFWGPYMAERQWGTVREDYSAGGDAWNYMGFEQSHSVAYKWGEDGIAGISDIHQYLCFAVTMWNGKDPLLKEKLFGLSNPQGNHGEDVKELYYYLDNMPTHSYMKYLYKYPQAEFPYNELRAANAQRSRLETEFEILDTSVFREDNYFDVTVEYAKAGDEDICIKISVLNRAPVAAPLHLLPTLFFRNIWENDDVDKKPLLKISGRGQVNAYHPFMDTYQFYYEPPVETLMTNNISNTNKMMGKPTMHLAAKDAFHEALVYGNEALHKKISRRQSGTKFSPHYETIIEPGEEKVYRFRISKQRRAQPFHASFEDMMQQRKLEADAYYHGLINKNQGEDRVNIYRQAMAGLLWNKQFYYYDVERWLEKDADAQAFASRQHGRNADWCHLKIADVVSMPDKWEYPWFAAWDLCFQCVPMAVMDPGFAKNQLVLLCREWLMSPQGEIPAYEWNFGDVNPPIHAWASLLVYNIDKKVHGNADIIFLKRMFHKLSINFTWWANREDDNRKNIFSGGFLGLDNIGVIDRSGLPAGFKLEQVDATAWMGMYALNMMEMALEISQIDSSYEDMVTKYYEHFVLIASSLNNAMWDENDNFFYDQLHAPDGTEMALKVRSIVGLSVLFDATVIKYSVFQKLEDFQKRMQFFRDYREKQNLVLPFENVNADGDILVTLIQKERIIKLLNLMLDENEFLAPGGLRALSKYHEEHPFAIHLNNMDHSISYLPGESDNSMFGGNSNWRGPVWVPINYLLIETLYTLHKFYGDSFQIAYPTSSDRVMNLKEVADAISERIVRMFTADEHGARLAHGPQNWFYTRPENHDLLLFYEYFNGDTANGLGASHQTGWTSLVAVLIHQLHEEVSEVLEV